MKRLEWRWHKAYSFWVGGMKRTWSLSPMGAICGSRWISVLCSTVLLTSRNNTSKSNGCSSTQTKMHPLPVQIYRNLANRIGWVSFIVSNDDFSAHNKTHLPTKQWVGSVFYIHFGDLSTMYDSIKQISMTANQIVEIPPNPGHVPDVPKPLPGFGDLESGSLVLLFGILLVMRDLIIKK